MNNESKELFKAILYLGILPVIVLISLIVGLDGVFITEKQWSDAVETQVQNSMGTIMVKSGSESYKCFTEPPKLSKSPIWVGQAYCYSRKQGLFFEASVVYEVERTNDLENIKLTLVEDSTTMTGYTRIK